MSDATPTEEGNRSPSLGGRVEEVCDRFEAAWKAGRRPPIEDYLGEVPEAGADGAVPRAAGAGAGLSPTGPASGRRRKNTAAVPGARWADRGRLRRADRLWRRPQRSDNHQDGRFR